MKSVLIALSAALLMLVSGKAGAQVTNWNIAPGYSVAFSTSGDAAGIFKTMKGSIKFDPANAGGSSFQVSIDVASINTGNGLMNTHAKSAEWFDATKYPEITFQSTKITGSGSNFQAVGNLTMHGVTKPITIPFTFQRTGAGATFQASFKVNRVQFGVGKSGDVDDDIALKLSVPVTK
jgi:polyisoprenoid-binding protein YceI